MTFIQPKTFYRVKTALITTIIGPLVFYDLITVCEVEMCLSDCAIVRDKLTFTVNCGRCRANVASFVHATGPWSHLTVCRIICLLALFQFLCIFLSPSQPIHSLFQLLCIFFSPSQPIHSLFQFLCILLSPSQPIHSFFQFLCIFLSPSQPIHSLFQFLCIFLSPSQPIHSPTTFYFPLFIQFHLTIQFFCLLYYFSSLYHPV
jgi:hypothetical protein